MDALPQWKISIKHRGHKEATKLTNFRLLGSLYYGLSSMDYGQKCIQLKQKTQYIKGPTTTTKASKKGKFTMVYRQWTMDKKPSMEAKLPLYKKSNPIF
jgi:hypothetical protein